ncbi:MAG: outer membrane lipoprotein-sorting protein [Ectothiorhodospiraceae bacterium]|nr:outer membrane lipoprotein-sorting protein [Chromatiales bacterium]MCP5154892.1 outer membrane lipoprotein-sorting protein [Ectothiorhodospiraceae bacterium]
MVDGRLPFTSESDPSTDARPRADTLWRRLSADWSRRRPPRLASIVLLVLATLAPPVLADPLADGKALAQRVHDRDRGKDLSWRGTMVLAERGREPRVRNMFMHQVKLPGDETRSLLRFTAPADVAGTGVVTIDYAKGNADQWVYLPALKRSRRISADRRGGRFVGSDYYYEDLQVRKVSLDRHRHLGREKMFNADVDVLESVPVDPSNSVYGKRVTWIHPGTLLPLRVDFFEPGGAEPLKRLLVHKIEKIQGYWTVTDTSMTDLKTGSQTRLVIERAVYDRGLPTSLFSTAGLEDAGRETAYRP